MMRLLQLRVLAVVLCLGLSPNAAAAQTGTAQPLRVLTHGPEGEVASLEEAKEIRVVFSEPMVTLGRIPDRVTAPFFRVSPALPGTFRWSGTTILIFTPDPKRPLPFATRYAVTIDTSATAVSGRKLARPHQFSFVTPTVKLLETSWYRRDGRAGAPMVILLRFNQPVDANAVAPHISTQFAPHEWTPPALPGDAAARLKSLDPTSIDRFNAKVAATRAVTTSQAPIGLELTNDWDKKQHPPGRNLVVFETTTAVPPDAWVRVNVAPTVPSAAGRERPQGPSEFTIKVEPTFFVDGFYCTTQCPADAGNPFRFTTSLRTVDYAAAVQATDITTRAKPVPVVKSKPKLRTSSVDTDFTSAFSLEDAGFERQPPARTYAITVAPSLRSLDGQTLGYTWSGTVENWHERAFTSFGDGHGVWEHAAGAQLPFYARNFRTVRQWAQGIGVQDLLPTIRRLEQIGVDSRTRPDFSEAPASEAVARKLNVTNDRIQSHGLDLSKALGPQGTGLVWAAVEEGDPIPRADRISTEHRVRASIVQVTNLGISVKDSPLNTLVFVTRLDNGAPVATARVSIIDRDNKSVWTGTTSDDGVAIAPRTPTLRSADDWWRFSFVVTAEKDGDIAYVGSDWNEGILPWNFGVPFNLRQAQPMLRGTVFSDRGVYRLGEEVQFKAILRHNTAQGVRLLPAGTPVTVSVRDSQSRLVAERTLKVNTWSSAEWTMTLPAEGNLGHYSVRAILESDKPKPRKPEELQPGDDPGPDLDEYVQYQKAVHGSFLVAAYRRPDFRVDVTLTAGAAMAGDAVKGTVAARYLFGAPMPGRPATWTWSRSRGSSAPQAVEEALPDGDRWVFVGWSESAPPDESAVVSREAKTARSGDLTVDLPTKRDAGVPYHYLLEADVEDVSRQHIANRASVVVHPAPWYVGVKRPEYFLQQKSGLSTEIVTIAPAGQIVAGVPVEIKLTQIQWNSVRRAEGNGFYTWDTERKEVPAGTWTVTTADKPVPLNVPLPSGGYFEVEATAREASGRFAVTRTSFYALGAGYTAWERFDHNRIALVADKPRYKPGDTARIMIQSPWEQATALVTTEREGIRSHRQFALTSTQQSIAIPVTEDDIPNVFVSVLLIRGRTAVPVEAADAPRGGPNHVEDPSDPGKPSFRLGYVQLHVEDHSKRLTVTVNANRQEYRPATDAQVRIQVADHQDRPAASEVTLWAVDYGVLSLTSYRTPDVLRSVYVEKALQVMNTDSRQRIISRRVLTPKGESEGGGGGVAADGVRKDFRVLAFWLGSVTTDASGRASIDVKLPESLTTYRIMAVAGDRASRFGSGESEIRVNKPLTMKPAFPRFLSVGDRALFGAVVTSQLPTAGDATITIRSLDPGVLEFGAVAEQTIPIRANGSIESRFDAVAKAIGRARVQMTVRLGNETDAFEDVIPVEVLVSPETVAAYGQLAGETQKATETLTIPERVVPGYGGLSVEMSSTAMVGLGEGARYLVEYPYGCAEQRGSRALALLLAADLGDAFTLPGMDTAKMRPAVQQTLKELERFQCADGGFAYWPGVCESRSAYLTSYILHIFKVASDLEVRRGQRRASARLRLPGARARAAAADQRGLVAGLYGLAGVRGEGHGRGRPQPGFQSDAVVRLPRSDAGLRARLPARRDARER